MKILIDLQGAQSESHRRGIGRYTREVTRALVQRAGHHEIHIALTATLDEATDALLAGLADYLPGDRIHYLRLPYGTNAAERSNAWKYPAARRLMRSMLERLEADVVWHSSLFEGLSEDAIAPDAPSDAYASCATLYDLIPLHDERLHLGSPTANAWYRRRLDYLRSCDALLSISQWTRRDALDRLRLDADRISVIGGGVDATFRPLDLHEEQRASVLSRLGINRPFVLYNGGLEERKNVGALIAAFAQLPAALRENHQLVIVGKGEAPQRHLGKLVRNSRLDGDAVVLTGFIPDDDLVLLYNTCALFVFPSKIEGFGLPPLEAMACGAPVICSSAASLPEVVGRQDVLFDPNRLDDLCARMASVLRDPDFTATLREYNIARAREFDWTSVANRALQALEAAHERRSARTMPIDARPALICISEDGRMPEQLQFLHRRFELSSVDVASAWQADLPDRNRLYVTDGSPSSGMIALAKDFPGVALLLEPAAERTPAVAHDDRLHRETYKAGGYASLLHLREASPSDSLSAVIPLLAHASGILAESARLLEALARLGVRGRHVAGASSIGLLNEVDRWLQAAKVADQEASLISDLAGLEGSPSEDDLAQAALAISSMRQRPKQWLVDVSAIARKDIGTGIQQVVRNVLRQWLLHPPADARVEPIRFHDGHYRYARRYACDLLGLWDTDLEDGIVSASAGDVFIGLDWALEEVPAAKNRLQDWRRGGMECCFVVYDLLPLTMPANFHPYSRLSCERWIRDVCYLSDRIACISRTTADELSSWLDAAEPTYQFGRRPRIDTFPLGAEAAPAAPCEVPLRAALAAATALRPSLLMVGTLEPRKRHALALDVAEHLWRQGVDFNLVVAGRRGWLTEDVVERFQQHGERGRRLFWHDDIGDTELHQLYAQCDALLALSEGEGYGLPLVDAARHGLPVLASDLSIFREVLGDYPFYLSGDPARWNEEIATWLGGSRERRTPLPLPGWSDSARHLAAIAEGRQTSA